MATLVSVDRGYLAVLPGMLAMGLGMGPRRAHRGRAAADPSGEVQRLLLRARRMTH
jgi:hypothetical protein